MSHKISKGNGSLATRLDEIRMSEHDRIRAKAQLARAEAIAEMLADATRWVAGLFNKPASGRPATHAG